MDWIKEKVINNSVLRNKYFYYSLIFILVNVLLTNEILVAYGAPHRKKILFIEVLFEVALLAMIHFVRKKTCSMEKMFLAIAIPIGVCFAVFMPFGQVPDEASHIHRSYGISNGVFVVPVNDEGKAGSDLPANIDEYSSWDPTRGTISGILKNVGTSVSDENQFVKYGNTASYNPLCYIPQVVGLLISRVLNLPLIPTLIMGRLFNFLSFVALIFFSIKFVPKYKTFILFCSILPISFQQAASFSPDALAIGICTFMIAFVLKLAYSKEIKPMNRKEIVLLYVLAIMIGLLKAVYLPLLLMYFLIPKERFGSKKAKTIHAISMALLVLLVDVVWFVFASKYFTTPVGGEVLPDQQKAFLMRNPFNSIIILGRSIAARITFYLQSMLGNSLGTFQIPVPDLYFYSSLIIMVLLLSQNKEGLNNIKKWERGVISLSFVGIIMMIFMSLYIQWTTVGASIVEGVQGRYFLPILLLLPVIITVVPKKKSEIRPSAIKAEHLLLYGVFINVCAIVCVVALNL